MKNALKPWHPFPGAGVGYLRRVVAWATKERADRWYPASGVAVPMDTVIGVYAAVHYLGAELEEVIADDLPFPFRSYNEDERAAINYVREALSLPPHT